MTAPDPAGPFPGLDAARAAVAASGLRWAALRGDARLLQPGRRRTRVLDLVVIEGRVGRGEAAAGTLVLTAGAPLGPARGHGEHPARVGVLEDGTAWWWAPHDPGLPGLAAALDPEHVAGWLSGLGPLERLSRVAYRPRERAVVEAAWSQPPRRAYLKVLAPHAVHPVHRRLRLAHAAGVPVPGLVAPPEAGVLALDTVPGRPWRALWAGPSAAALDPRAVEDVLDRLPAALLADDDDPPARAWAPDAAASGATAWGRLVDHAAWAGTLLDPDAEAETARVADAARELLARGDAGPVVPVHGDLHPGNLHVDATGERITGLLDADTLGAGHRVDDWGALVGHLAAAHADRAPDAGALAEILARHRAYALRSVDPVALAARAGATVFALAGQPDVPPHVRAGRRAAAWRVLGAVR